MPGDQRMSVLYWLDVLIEAGLYFMIIFTPWAFGCTPPWAIQIMTVTGYTLGGLTGLRWLISRALGEYMPRPGWDAGKVMDWALGGLTVLILLYCWVSAWNARATYRPGDWAFDYHRIIPWLPHSYDAEASWEYFRMYLGLGLAFWAARTWLLNGQEDGFLSERLLSGGGGQGHLLPPRLRRLLWVVSINGAVLALVSIIQRVDGTSKLLWMVEPRVNKEIETFFGPFFYRANAAQYFNLAWPAALALWWSYHRAKKQSPLGQGTRGHNLLLSCVLLMAVCPVVSTSRGGALIMLALSVLVVVILWVAEWQRGWGIKLGIVGLFALVLGGGLLLGWEELGPRMEILDEGYYTREAVFETAKKMADDHPVFGTGPGSFMNLFQLYRKSYDEYWPAQLHNDWLETRITFGWVGFLLILAALVICLLRWQAPGGIRVDRYFVWLLYAALGGCLLHARYDLPLQIYSILFLFLLLCAILSTLTRE